MGSKYTKAERRKFYIEAAKIIKSGKEEFACHALERAGGLGLYDAVKNEFPEFYLFKPFKHAISWWQYCDGSDIEGRRFREIALLLSAEMCND